MANEVRMDLKVCEGCGALWLRAIGTTEIYCKRCVARLATLPKPTAKLGRFAARPTRGGSL